MRRLFSTAVVALFCLPIAGWADITGSPTLASGTALNLDTGATGATGDLLWNGTQIVPQSPAGAFLFPSPGSQTIYDALPQSAVSGFLVSGASITPTANAIIIAKSKTGNYAKLLVNSVTGGTLSLKFTIFVAAVPTGPNITAIANNYGQVPQGLPNYGIAPSTLIYIQGTGLANTTTDLQSSAAPGLQTTLSGVSVAVTVGSTTVQCPLYYLSPTQIDAVLPGNTPTGTGSVVVTNNGAKSPAVSINIVQSAFGILFYNGTLAAAYDANNALLTNSNSANPNQPIVLWGSGVGADPSDDDKLFPQKQDNLTSIPIQVYVGGVQASILYQGRSQYPGVDQIVITLPGNVPTGCFVSVAVVSGSVVSNSVTIPIAASGRTCSDPNGLPSNLVGTTVRSGLVSVSRSNSISSTGTTNSNSIIGAFSSVTNYGSTGGSVSINSCLVTNTIQRVNAVTTPLDAGSSISVTGPAGPLSLIQASVGGTLLGAYLPSTTTLPAGYIPDAGGAYTFDNGSGGKDIGHFNTTVNLAPVFTWTNTATITSVNRTQGVTVTWSGGAPGTTVTISGSSTATIAGKSQTVSFICEAPISAGQFTVPVPVLLSLPAGSGGLAVGDFGNYQMFTANGLDLAYATSSDTTSKSLAYN